MIDKERLTLFSVICILSVSFSYRSSLARTSNMLLKGMKGHPFPGPHLCGKASGFPVKYARFRFLSPFKEKLRKFLRLIFLLNHGWVLVVF